MDDTGTPEGRALEPARLPGAPVHPRANALLHGLTATTLLDEDLGADAYTRTSAALRQELQPSGLPEEALLGRIAHGVGALELSRRAEMLARCLPRAIASRLRILPGAGFLWRAGVSRAEQALYRVSGC